MSNRGDGEIAAFLRAHGPFEPPPRFPAGSDLDDWQVLAFLGRGGSAEVFRARNRVTGIVAALKILVRSDERARARFQLETRLLAELHSAAFPRFYGAGCADGHYYIAEELLEPKTLPNSDATVARFVREVSAGVGELHRRGLVHRDIKPGNVMMRPSTGESVLVDFGLAKRDEVADQTVCDTSSLVDGRVVGVGTPGFSAPEQFTGGRIGVAADIHALGVLVNACFGGNPPRAWRAIIRRATSSIPEQRYATVAEFISAVRSRHAARWWLAAVVASALAATVVAIVTPAQTKGTSSDLKISGDSLSEAVFDVFYGGETNLDRKTSLELMRKGIPPSY